MIRKKKNYSRPMQPFQAERIKDENALRVKYGLKNKTEIWKTVAKVNYLRGRAKALAKMPLEEQEVLFNKLKAIGLETNTIADVLDLKVENLLERRLSTVLVKKKIADTPKQARQMITHKRVLINGKVMSAPGYLVPVSDEKSITLKVKQKKPKVEKEVADAPVQEEISESQMEQSEENTEAEE